MYSFFDRLKPPTGEVGGLLLVLAFISNTVVAIFRGIQGGINLMFRRNPFWECITCAQPSVNLLFSAINAIIAQIPDANHPLFPFHILRTRGRFETTCPTVPVLYPLCYGLRLFCRKYLNLKYTPFSCFGINKILTPILVY